LLTKPARRVDVEHHDDEEEQHRNGADIDYDQQHREKLGPYQHKQAGRREER